MTMIARDCVILVGHGGVPTDCPSALVSEFKKQEAAARGNPTPALEDADRKLREWPRTPKTDPYKTGLEAIAKALADALPDCLVLEAYNEFCAPSLEAAFAAALARGAKTVTVVSTMYTRGGSHSELEIPQILERLQKAHPDVGVRYAWPFELAGVVRLLASQVRLAQAAAR